MTGAHNRFIYLHYFTTFVHNPTNLQPQDAAMIPMASAPHYFRGPPLLAPWCAPLPLPPLAAPAHMGSGILGSSHQQWHLSLTVGH